MASHIQLLVSDVDGTLVNSAKGITPSAKQAVNDLRQAGIRFTVTSSRPPRGLQHIISELAITEPVAAFNGGLIATPGFEVVHQALLDSMVAQKALAVVAKHKIDAWVFTAREWLVRDLQGPHVQHEIGTVRFEPRVVSSFDAIVEGVGKIVAVTDDRGAIQACEAEIKNVCGRRVSASCSQPYYLDVTHPDANKGEAISVLSRHCQIPTANIATIGDGANDVLMFRNSGLSIAMGNGSVEVKAAADFVTASNNEEGFARAIQERILSAVRSQTSATKS